MIEPRPLSSEEIDALDGQPVKTIGAGMDAFVFQTGDGRTVAVMLCMGCFGHVAYYEIDPDLVETGPDYTAG